MLNFTYIHYSVHNFVLPIHPDCMFLDCGTDEASGDRSKNLFDVEMEWIPQAAGRIVLLGMFSRGSPQIISESLYLWFEITVHDPGLMHKADSWHQTFHQFTGLPLSEQLFPFQSLQQLPPTQQLHHQISMVLRRSSKIFLMSLFIFTSLWFKNRNLYF